MSIKVVGDVHGKYESYLKLLFNDNFSLQIGDFGFDYACLNTVNDRRHKLIGGNHDRYPDVLELPHSLGDYGMAELNGVSFFYVRGGFSIDKAYRTPGYNWFPEEELCLSQGEDCLNLYETVKPDIVISHEGPFRIVPYVAKRGFVQQFGFKDPLKTFTNTLLELMHTIHTPKLHIFGHYHTSFNERIGNTQYVCLNELETYVL